ncbi:MAG: 2-C-methyl-D-erythritol 4-phosphate cytidylyltransferase [Pseudomonadota bacterium]|jgi:2-C-methyl-D-erythritol 4-phosphate cytidylyltransferase
MSRKFALVPAAGSGSRMGGECPKQYLPLAGRPLIFHTLDALCRCAEIEAVFVVLAPDDRHWGSYDWSPFGSRLKPLWCGGASRAESVSNGLAAMAGTAGDDDWVLVHDAARPCLSQAQLARLIREVGEDAVGGILAVPVADTLKRDGGDGRIGATVERSGLWQAQTPQMFRYRLLRRALEATRAVTDEAGAIEAQGHRPRLVAADITNLKVTYPQDLQLAAWILANRGET